LQAKRRARKRPRSAAGALVQQRCSNAVLL
jgi:hypothetical protein